MNLSDINKLNEELKSLLEKQEINEISYETKKSYLAKRQAQLDKAQSAMNKAQRLIRNTEYPKQGKRKLTTDQLKQLISNLEQQFPKYGDRYFYSKVFQDWGSLEAGDVSEYSNSCKINITFTDKYLSITIYFTGEEPGVTIKKEQEKFSLDDFTFTKLNSKVINYVKQILKISEKEQIKGTKSANKQEKLVKQIKTLLSKLKTNILDTDNPRDERIADALKYSGAEYKSIVSFPSIFVNSIKGYDNDYTVKAIALKTDTNLRIVYDSIHSNTVGTINGLKAAPEEKEKLLNKILEILSDKIQGGRSTLKSDEKKIAAKKELAKEAIEEYKSLMRKGNYDKIDPIKENGNSYEFITHYWGDWEGDDYDFERPTKDTRYKIETICDQLQKKYPDLKFSYGISEKHMLDCSVSWS